MNNTADEIGVCLQTHRQTIMRTNREVVKEIKKLVGGIMKQNIRLKKKLGMENALAQKIGSETESMQKFMGILQESRSKLLDGVVDIETSVKKLQKDFKVKKKKPFQERNRCPQSQNSNDSYHESTLSNLDFSDRNEADKKNPSGSPTLANPVSKVGASSAVVRKNGLTKEYAISPQLCKFMNTDFNATKCRSEVTKYIHSYIRENSLKADIGTASFTLDESLSTLFDMHSGEKIPYFTLPKLLNTHFQYEKSLAT